MGNEFIDSIELAAQVVKRMQAQMPELRDENRVRQLECPPSVRSTFSV